MFSRQVEMNEKFRELKAATWRWLHDLAGLVPSSLTRPKGPRILLVETTRGIQVNTVADGQFSHVGTLGSKQPSNARKQLNDSLAALDRKGADIVLRLSREHVLQNEIRLPKAARDVLEPVIANQLDEMTPWPQAETMFGYRVEEDASAEDGESDHFTVEVVATSRKIVDTALASARALELEPRVVEFAPADDPGEGIVIHGGGDKIRIRIAERIGSTLGAFLILAAVIGGNGLAIMLWQQFALSELQDQVKQHRSTLASLSRRDAPTLNMQRQSRELTALKSDRPSILITLEVLSRALPDTAWLASLEVRGDDLRLRGKANNAPDLIADLEKLPYFENVQFSAPTTRQENEQQEDFSISAKLLPMTSLE